MAEQTTDDGLTVDQIDAAYEVLEVVGENLHDENMDNLAGIINEADYLVEQYEEQASWSKDWDLPEVGDILIDLESNPRYGDGSVEVVEVLDKPSSRCYIETETGRKSVAFKNKGHPADAPVVKATYVDGSDKVYHFPCTRLRETWQ